MGNAGPAALSIKGLRKVYRGGFTAVSDLDLELTDGACDRCVDVCSTRVFDRGPGYRHELRWGSGRALGARTAVGPTVPE